jgi:hypothetical protein
MTTVRSPKMGQFTKEIHEAFRKEQDEKAAKVEEVAGRSAHVQAF